MTTTAGAKADYFIVYTLSGEKIKPIYAYGNDHNLKDLAKQVIGYNSGLISFADKGVEVREVKQSGNATSLNNVYKNNIMTDTNTQVFVIDAKSGDYVEGALSDISRNSYVYVPVINKDGYAEVVLVDDYHGYGSQPGTPSTPSGTVAEPTVKLQRNGTAMATLSGVTADATRVVSGDKVTVNVYVNYETDRYDGYEITINYGSQAPVKGSTTATFDVEEDAGAPQVVVNFLK